MWPEDEVWFIATLGITIAFIGAMILRVLAMVEDEIWFMATVGLTIAFMGVLILRLLVVVFA